MTSHSITKAGSQALTRTEAEFEQAMAKLSPATTDEAMSVIKFMFKVLPLAATDEDDDDAIDILIAAYQIACSGQPKWALVQARDAFIRGEVEDHKSPYCPNPATFGREVTRIVDKVRLDATRAKRRAQEEAALRAESAPQGPMSDEARAAVERFLGKSRQVADEMREDMRRRPEPKTPRAGYAARVAEEVAARRAARSEA